LKGKQQSQQSGQSGQSAARQSCIHEWTFLGKIWSINDQSFCNVHNVVLKGMDGHCCTRLKGKQHSQQSAACQSCIQKWTSLGKIWSKNDKSFCNIHNVVIQEKLHIPAGVAKAFLVL
jgi:hypothetical protein